MKPEYNMNKTNLDKVLNGPDISNVQKVRLILGLSLPAILAQLTTIAMQYIDAAMVGSLGAGDTLRPSVMNLVSMWCVRIIPAIFLVPRLGLAGYWTVMAVELCFRGLIFLVRLYRGKWMKKALV